MYYIYTYILLTNIPVTIDIWLVVGIPTPLKNDGLKVSWDDDSHILWENKNKFQPTNQNICCMLIGRFIITLYYHKTKHWMV